MLGMTKRFGAFAFVFLASAFSFATVTVSGTLVNPATGLVSSRAKVRFVIHCNGSQPVVTGTGVIIPGFTELTPDASGVISGTLYSSATEISCGQGNAAGTGWYGVIPYYDGKPGPEVSYTISGASWNYNSATPNTVAPTVTAPTGDSTYARLDGGNDPFTGSIMAPGFQPTGDPTYNVKAYGATGNGSTDDTSAIQAAITAAVATSGTVFIPCGTFKITSQLNVSGNGRFAIQGNGDCSVISFDGSTVTTALGSPDTTQRNLIRIDNLHFVSTTVGSGLAIDASHWTQSSIEHINAFGVNACVLMNNVHSLYNIVFKIRCSVSGTSSYGIKFDSTANENTVMKARIITTSASTGVIVNTQGIKLYDVDVETGALIGIDVQASARTTFISGAWLELNQTNLQLASGAVATTVIGSEINSGTTADITDAGATGTVMCGVRKNFVSQPCTFGSGLITSNTNPAASGAIRLANGDIIKARNNANGADRNLIKLGAGNDAITIGDSSVTSVALTGTATSIFDGTRQITITPSVGAATFTSSGSITSYSFDKALSANAISGTSLGLTGLVSTYNNITTAGQGVTWIPCVTSQKSESAADANVLTCTPPAAVGSYRIRFTEAVSAQNTATLGWTATWTDANGSAHAPTNLALFKAGTAAPALTFVAATNDAYYGSIDIDVDNSATAIVVKLTFAGTSFTAKASASIERIQ